MNSTPLSFLIDTMDQHRDFANLELQYKVRALDTAIRMFRQGTNFPWNLKKGTLKIFHGVNEYPIDSDHDEIGYIEKQSINGYYDTARFFNTSLQQFYEEVNSYRNLMADIWKDGTRMIGLKARDFDIGEVRLSSAEVASEYTASDDASNAVLDNITYKEGNGSIKFDVVNSSGIATIKNTTNIGSDSDYNKKYHFKWVYLSSVPTSIELRLQTDDSNYLKTVVTTQFAGNAFKADDWNLVAHDLNDAAEEGTFNSGSIASEKLIMNGASDGTYRVDNSYIREWKLMDKWYYSKNNVISIGGSTADKEYFIETDESSSDINLLDELVGDSKWIGVLLYSAMRTLLADIENVTLLSYVTEQRTKAERAFNSKYPSLTPLITTLRKRYINEPNHGYFI